MNRGRLMVGAAAAAAAVLYGVRRRSRLDMNGRVVLITGGSRGLGLELAREFAGQGARLGLLARSRDELERAGADIAAYGTAVELLPADLRSPEQAQRAVERLVGRFGRLDVLANVAGTITVGPLVEMELDDFRREMDTNFHGALHATLAALPYLRTAPGGRIMNVTSIGGRLAVPHLLPYTASKFALVGFSEGLTAELRREGIAVTTVTPGLMRTGSPYRARFRGRQERELRWFLLGDSLPGASISARAAARRMVAACRRGDASLIVPSYLRLPIAAHALAPGWFSALAGGLNSLLPAPADRDGDRQPREGLEVMAPEHSPPYAFLTRRAARRNNQLGDRAEPGTSHEG